MMILILKIFVVGTTIIVTVIIIIITIIVFDFACYPRCSEVMQFRSGEELLQRGCTDRALFCVYSGRVACKSPGGKVNTVARAVSWILAGRPTLFTEAGGSTAEHAGGDAIH